MQKLFVIGSFIAVLFLTGCSKNPLQKMSSEEAAQLLVNACTDAMEAMGVYEPGISSRYAQCMEHRVKEGFDCNTLYGAMAKQFMQQGIHVSKRQVQDSTFYAQIREELNLRAIFSK
ncbi:MAG: hypothetical protein WA877_09545 [Legionella sp.]